MCPVRNVTYVSGRSQTMITVIFSEAVSSAARLPQQYGNHCKIHK
jgi:hypothetical protein